MKIQTFTHGPDAGWSVALPAELDSEGTLVVVFGAPEYADAPAPLEELVAAFPKSAIVGCSSAGEIHGCAVADRTSPSRNSSVPNWRSPQLRSKK